MLQSDVMKTWAERESETKAMVSDGLPYGVLGAFIQQILFQVLTICAKTVYSLEMNE